MKSHFLLKAFIVFTILLGVAYVFDCVRSVNKAWSQIQEIDEVTKQLEERYIVTARTLGDESSEFAAAVQEYEGSKVISARRNSFEKIVQIANKAAIKVINPSNPVQRRTGDELSGALNRIRMNESYFLEALKNYRETKNSYRGSIASLVMALPQE